MTSNALIYAISQAEKENMQDIMDAVIQRYRQLYPDWEFIYFTRDKNRPMTSMEQKILQLAYEMDEPGTS